MSSLFKRNIDSIQGIGSKRAQLFDKLGAPTVGALLFLYPRAYEDWSNIYKISEAPFETPCCVKATISSPVSKSEVRKNITLYKVRAYDDTAVLNITFFNNRFVCDKLKEGEEFLFFGKLTFKRHRYEMISPLFENTDKGARIRPIYPQTNGLTSRQIELAVKKAMRMLPEKIKDNIPQDILEKYDLCSLEFAIKNIHFPENKESLEIARKRLAFGELLSLQLKLMKLKDDNKSKNTNKLKVDYSKEFFSLLPFSPTIAQERVVAKCIGDMIKNGYRMNRLIQGDVGCGKTAVAAAVCYTTIKNGFQVAFMAPTEVLAEQHFHFFNKILLETDIKIELLTGSVTAKNKNIIKENIKMGNVDLVLGTHALISDDVEFLNLGLVVTDEQHRFGVNQRLALVSKGNNPHTIVMSATPIPRTLALIIYGDLDISVIDELPPGRQKIDTFHIESAKRNRVFDFLKKLMDQGRQGYIICPLIEDGETDLISAQKYYEDLSSGEFKDYNLGLIHGKMKSAEKDNVMRKFSSGEIDLLISTTVIEVGVDVPNAVLMIIENAERFGLSQLHQLRGRVGRGQHKSYCILISDARNEDSLKRFEIITKSTDGFKIADEDLKLRGPGDFWGSRQHGLPNLKIANMATDINIFIDAQNAAKEIFNRK